ncbi:MAG TPA: Sec-independent protein translocase protein TatB [Aurantimonas sp.]|jgi:sec-independent protein translocase protein TatB|nr:Sec-independent protein translocase protein TatB [Aurantimonas sp.]
MLDIAWTELLVIAIILVIVVGPKDLPRMLRTFGRTTKQIRSMASDFRRQFDDALREAELDEVRQTMSDAKKFDPTKDVRAAMSPMKAIGDEIRSSLTAATKAPEPTVPASAAKAEPSSTAGAEPPSSASAGPAESGAAAAGVGDAGTAAPQSEAKARKTEDAA